MEKGISTIIAVVLLVMIVVALISFLWMFANTLFNTTASSGKASIENITYRMIGCLRIENVNPKTGEMMLRNCGPTTLSSCNVFADNANIMSDSRTFEPNSIFSIALNLAVGVHDIFVTCDNAQSLSKTVEIADFGQPKWFDSYVNSTLAGSPVLHSLRWTSNVGLSGYIFSFDNCTGSFNNESWNSTNFNGLSNAWSNVTKTINSTVGCTIRWKVYANDTSNRWNVSPSFSYAFSYDISSSSGGSGCGNGICDSESGENQNNCPHDCGYPPSYCDFHIHDLSESYNITQSNSVYCLDNDASINDKDAIDFAPGVQNTTLDCNGYNINMGSVTYIVNSFGVNLNGNDMNNTIKNCNIICNDNLKSNGIYLNSSSSNNLINSTINNCHYGLEILYNSNNNTLLNNTINSDSTGIYIALSSNNILFNNIINSDSIGIRIALSSNNILFNNIIINNVFGIVLDASSSNNVVKGGSIKRSAMDDYYILYAGTTNNFTNTDFTDYRIINFGESGNAVSFNYNNETNGNIWLKTIAYSTQEMKRKLINWNNTLMQWNDTSISGSTTAYYNITGLLANTNYSVYNNTYLYTLNSGPSGEVDFNITLPSNQERNIIVLSGVTGVCGNGICESGENWFNCLQDCRYPSYCKFFIDNSTIPFTISQNNTYYCLNHSIGKSSVDGIDFASGVQNTTLDCLGYNINSNGTTGSFGVYLNGINNNTVNNCNITNFTDGFYLSSSTNNNLINNIVNNNYHGIMIFVSNNNILTNDIVNNNTANGIVISQSNNNILTNNIVNNNTANGIVISQSNNNILTNNTAYSNGQFGIHLYFNSKNNTLTNNSAYGNLVGIRVESNPSNNTVSSGSVLNNIVDYSLYSAGTTNNFTNTNFTGARIINFKDATSWFNYADDTSGLWLKTGVSAATNITRKLIRWSQIIMQWNDTSNTAITAYYNVTGLLTKTNYAIYNNTYLYTLNSGPSGEVDFNITLPANQESNITIQVEGLNCNFFIENSIIPFTISQSNKVYCLIRNIGKDGVNGIVFNSGIQNTTLDCLNYNINSNRIDNTWGVFMTDYSTKNNTVKNCIINGFSQGIYLFNGASNNILTNNTINYNSWYGIDFFFNCNNNILNNNTFKSNRDGIYIAGSGNNIITGGSIASSSRYDYYLANAGINNFTNTGFTTRIIHFDSSSWFNYNNETTENIWLKTNVDFLSTITRKLINWNQTLMQWNDDVNSAIANTLYYNVTGLLTNTNYAIYNNTYLYTLNSGPSGEVDFNISLPQIGTANITVQKV